MDFTCYTDFDSGMHKLDTGKRITTYIRGALTVCPFPGTIYMDGWPIEWNAERLSGTWTVSIFPLDHHPEAVRKLRQSVLSLMGWTVGKWKRSFSEHDGDFVWTTEVPFSLSPNNPQHKLRISIWTKAPEGCTVERVETLEKVVRYRSTCAQPIEEEDR